MSLQIIMTLLENQNAFRRQRRNNELRESGLDRPSAAANSNHQTPGHDRSSRILPAASLSASRRGARDLMPATAPQIYFLCRFFPPDFLAARSSITAWAAASRAIGTRNGDALT